MATALTKWIEVRNTEHLDRALQLARGCYQRNLLLGREAWSGSTLRGRASHYGARYAASRAHLLARLQSAGIPARLETRPEDHGRRVLVLGEPPTAFARILDEIPQV